jgi:restriction system protein
VAKKRGLLAEINRSLQQDARRRQQAQNQAVRQQAAAQRQAEQAARQAQRAIDQAYKASVADQKRAEQEAKRLHVEAMEAEVAAKNAELAVVYDEIDNMLSATLAVDDFVDLNNLRRVAEHPPFDPGAVGSPGLQPPRLQAPPEPTFVPPDGAPKGLSGVFGGKKKYAEVLAQAQAEHEKAHKHWQGQVADLPVRQQALDDDYKRAELKRQEQLAAAKEKYDDECRQREAEVEESNRALDQLIANLGYEVEDAIQEYVTIVLENSVYPDAFPVSHDFQFDSAHRELTLEVTVPAPSEVPSVREYKYVKAKDEIAETALPQKDQKDRYANAVAQVALRTLHEIFEADRAGRIQTISVTIATEALDVATGRTIEVPLVAVASDRATFEQLDLSNVVPAATLAHLKASVSKNPWGLVPINQSKGVRG